MKKLADINIGDTLGPLELVVSKQQCRNYAHWCGFDAPRFTDDEGARKEGLPGMILPGNMSLGLLAKLVTDWIGAGAGAHLLRIGTTYRIPVQPDRRITLHGFITHSDAENRTADIDVWIENDEAERLVIGTATVQFAQ
jgi:acyl dehydratase